MFELVSFSSLIDEENTASGSIDEENTASGNIDAENTVLGSTGVENRIWGSTDVENKTVVGYRTLENNQPGSIDENRRILLLHSLLYPILQFQEIPIRLVAL